MTYEKKIQSEVHEFRLQSDMRLNLRINGDKVQIQTEYLRPGGYTYPDRWIASGYLNLTREEWLVLCAESLMQPRDAPEKPQDEFSATWPEAGTVWREKANKKRTVVVLNKEVRHNEKLVTIKTLTAANLRVASNPSIIPLASFWKRFETA